MLFMVVDQTIRGLWRPDVDDSQTSSFSLGERLE